MDATIKLYDNDAYATSFTAKVLSCKEIDYKENKAFEVVLDQTLFFPEEGGQSPDQGTLGNATVLDVQIKENVIFHTVSETLEELSTVEGQIDWTHRFNNMQQHSGEHIFSGLVYKKYGYKNVGFHLSNQIVTMDFDGMLSPQQIEELEQEVNYAIAQNVEIKTGYPDKETLSTLNYRSKIEIDGPVRIVEVVGYDICACCAPHVRRTGEIGSFKVMNVQNYKGGVRISILCGFRALAAFREKAEIITELMGIFSTNQEAIVDNVQKLKAENQTLKNKLVAANKELMQNKLKEVNPEQRHVLLFEEDLDQNIMRAAVNELVEKHDGFCGIFNGNDVTGYSFIIGSSTLDCKNLANELREKLGARGGGSSQMIQGSLSTTQENIYKIIVGE